MSDETTESRQSPQQSFSDVRALDSFSQEELKLSLDRLLETDEIYMDAYSIDKAEREGIITSSPASIAKDIGTDIVGSRLSAKQAVGIGLAGGGRCRRAAIWLERPPRTRCAAKLTSWRRTAWSPRWTGWATG